jgi:hypothetical protein
MSDNKYMAFSIQIFLIFLLAIVDTVISTKSLTLRVLTFILIHSHLFQYRFIIMYFLLMYLVYIELCYNIHNVKKVNKS